MEIVDRTDDSMDLRLAHFRKHRQGQDTRLNRMGHGEIFRCVAKTRITGQERAAREDS